MSKAAITISNLYTAQGLAVALGKSYAVSTTAHGSRDIRPIKADAKANFVRVINDDNTFVIIHMTHNEVILGESRLNGSMLRILPTMIVETLA